MNNKLIEPIEYKAISGFGRGIIYKLLCESYAELLELKPDYKKEYQNNWRKTDDSIFNFPDSIGKCVLMSVFNNKPIGFISWDPRRIPDEGEIGQNCIIPIHRCKGYGKQQVQKVLEIFNAASTRIVKVITEDHPFFIPAQKTYLLCGFIETGRDFTTAFGGTKLIRYKLELTFTKNLMAKQIQ